MEIQLIRICTGRYLLLESLNEIKCVSCIKFVVILYILFGTKLKHMQVSYVSSHLYTRIIS
jgi:hypothetical protein